MLFQFLLLFTSTGTSFSPTVILSSQIIEQKSVIICYYYHHILLSSHPWKHCFNPEYLQYGIFYKWDNFLFLFIFLFKKCWWVIFMCKLCIYIPSLVSIFLAEFYKSWILASFLMYYMQILYLVEEFVRLSSVCYAKLLNWFSYIYTYIGVHILCSTLLTWFIS